MLSLRRISLWIGLYLVAAGLIATPEPAAAQERGANRGQGPRSEGAADEVSAANTADEAAGEPTEEARLRFRRGIELYRTGDYRAALIEFRRANEIAPNYRVLYNVGQTSYQLRDYATALNAFEAYLEAAGDDEISTERRTEVEDYIATLRGNVSDLTLEVSVPNAEVSIDGVTLGTSPLPGPVRVSQGRREVAVTATGYVPLRRVVDIAGGETLSVALRPIPLTASEETDEGGGLNETFWISLAATGALTIGAVVTGVLALQADGDLQDEYGGVSTPDEIQLKQDDLSNLTLATDLFITGAAIGAAITAILGFVQAKTCPETSEEDPRPNPEAVSVRLLPTGMRLNF